MGRPSGGHGERGIGQHPRRAESISAGEYLLLFDPLDGSSNIDVNVNDNVNVNVSIGTLFSVLRKVGHARGRTSQVSEEVFLQPGKHPANTRQRPATACTARRARWC